ncbi:PHB depolymerase family esterase [Salipiger sp. P9]|uniref:extracellular catalytic domain type 1 short-chain-length polyhydroxyalkanoate depolymerase n=1 Tax=Salipiger pentaromativorans TaxID=2943193 RepID=UPI0021577B87|nr:PHB depolymerase family esterase [Salipiger pentaromativorans]MCR8547147.1 PHB depolymerase family esterase [Salipiger pentaromativorans]
MPLPILPRLALLLSLLLPTAAPALERVATFGDNPGDLTMLLYRPEGHDGALPLVVALHGCTMSADSFDDETGLTALADAQGLLLLFPEQNDDNQPHKCFRWYDERDNRPGDGESASIHSMIASLLDSGAADPEQVFVMGLSAGGAMSAALLANYPDLFAGGAIVAGLPYDCNRQRSSWDGWWYSLRWSRMNPYLDGADASYACGVKSWFPTVDRAPRDWAGYVTEKLDSDLLAALEADPALWPRVSIWQGDADETVDPGNLEELADQWTAVQGLDPEAPDAEDTIAGATRKRYLDAQGVVRVETWDLPTLPHAVPVDEDSAPACGIAEGAYMNEGEICAVREIARFWGLL